MTFNDVYVTINHDTTGYLSKPSNYDANEITKRIRASKPVKINLQQFCQVISKGKTFISGCVIDPSANTLKATNTHNYAFFGLDVDNKEFEVSPTQMIEEVKTKLGIVPTIYYDTFSSTPTHKKFRLIYVFEEPIQKHEDFKKMYAQLKILFPTLIDQSTSNANRLWFATNKPQTVRLNPNAVLVGKDFFKKLDNVAPLEKDGHGTKKKNNIKYLECNIGEYEDIYKYISFKAERAHDLAEYVIEHIGIEDYLGLMGVDLRDNGSYLTCPCPFHGGDNETGFVIYKHSNSAFCFTKNCIAGDVINLCKIHENKTYFDAIRTLLNRFNLGVPMEYIDEGRLYSLLKGVSDNE